MEEAKRKPICDVQIWTCTTYTFLRPLGDRSRRDHMLPPFPSSNLPPPPPHTHTHAHTHTHTKRIHHFVNTHSYMQTKGGKKSAFFNMPGTANPFLHFLCSERI